MPATAKSPKNSMLDTSTIPPERRFPSGLDRVLPALTRCLQHLGLDFFLVGAVARDLWLDAALGSAPRRRTTDVDLAVLIAHEAEYDQLRAWLVAHEQFNAPASSAFCLIHEPTGIQVDLMPFGGIADAEGCVQVAGQGLSRISVAGLAEVLASAAPVRVNEQITWQVVTLPGLVALKLLAWDDRGEQRGKDGTDLRLILQHYHALIEADIIERHYELLVALEATEDELMRMVGIRVLGQEMQILVAVSPRYAPASTPFSPRKYCRPPPAAWPWPCPSALAPPTRPPPPLLEARSGCRP